MRIKTQPPNPLRQLSGTLGQSALDPLGELDVGNQAIGDHPEEVLEDRGDLAEARRLACCTQQHMGAAFSILQFCFIV